VSRPAQQAALAAAPNFRSGGILALDLARTFGWTYGLIGDPKPHYGSVWLREPTEDARYLAFDDWMIDAIERMAPAQLVLEAPLPLPAHTSLMITAQQLTLRGIARMEAWNASIPIFEVDPGTVRADIMGRRYFAKDTVKREVLRHCLRMGWRVPDHNAGDSALLWLWYCRQRLGIRPAAGPLFAGVN
jgi:hypothetical protein